MLEFLLSGSRWFQLALLCALVPTVRDLSRGAKVPASLELAPSVCNRFYGIVMAIMATGHMLAVTVLHHQGSLTSGASLPFLYAVGVVMLGPATLLVAIAGRLQGEDDRTRRQALALNVLLAIVLVASVASAPLAVPAVLNIFLLRKPSRRAARWAVAGSAMAYLAMFIASLFFRDF
jgi:hypothetical protein